MKGTSWVIVGALALTGLWWFMGAGKTAESEADQQTRQAYELVHAVLREFRFQLSQGQIDALAEGVLMKRLPSGDQVREAAARMSTQPFSDPFLIVFPDRVLPDPSTQPTDRHIRIER